MSPRVREIYERHVAGLSAEELRELGDLIEQAKAEEDTRTYDWIDLIGTAPYPLCGMDAQEWVSEGRRASDRARERQMR